MEKFAVIALVLTVLANILTWAGVAIDWVGCTVDGCEGADLWFEVPDNTPDDIASKINAVKAFALLTVVFLLVALACGAAFFAGVKPPTTTLVACITSIVAVVCAVIAVAIFADLNGDFVNDNDAIVWGPGFIMYIVVMILGVAAGVTWFITRGKAQ